MSKLRQKTLSDVLEVLRLADLLCQSLDLFAQVGVSIQQGQSTIDATISHWVGQITSSTNSRASYIVLQKMAALIAAEQLHGPRELIMTPVPGLEAMTEWQGGVAQEGVRVAVSKWAQEWDKLLALILLYHKLSDGALTLHHAGFSFINKADRDIELAECEGWLERPAADHERHYLPQYVGTDGRIIYRELQLGFGHNGRHWDFVVAGGGDPIDFLGWIANAYGIEPELWELGSNDPVGVVWILDSTDDMPFKKLGVMARSSYWEIK